MVSLSTDDKKDDSARTGDKQQKLGQLSDNALRVLRARYLKKDVHGQCTETPFEMFDRVSGTIAGVERSYGGDDRRVELWRERFFDLMVSGRFMPNSPTLMNAGREMGMLSACFVLPVPDSIDGIFESIKNTALIQKAGGGTGFAFDSLRPTGDYIKSSGGTTSGPISFWRAFSEATNAIQQGAFRRGANMGMMYITHPDIVKFLHAKQDLTQFTNYNISVKITDEWMEGFLAAPDDPHVVVNPRTGIGYLLPKDLDIWGYDIRTLTPYDPAKPPRGTFYTRRDVWSMIVTNAWQTGEPGVVFIDRINRHNPTPHVGRIEATNPCGEQPLLPYEACNLGSVNLAAFVRMPAGEKETAPRMDWDPASVGLPGEERVDWDGLSEAVGQAVRFLDNVIDANNYPVAEITAMCRANRKIGLGIMGFADALFKLGVAYSSEAGVAWGERFMKFVNTAAHDYSERLAIDRGCFPNWKGSRWDTETGRPMRNAAVTTVAPTGTISILAGCSGGIEPLFSLAFFRNVLKGQDDGTSPMIEVNAVFRKVAGDQGFYSEGLMDQIARDGTLAHSEAVPDEVKRVFVCAHDVKPEWHIRMQAAFQKHCDSSISKTINFPNQAKAEDVDLIYRRAYALGCKGVTVYRDGCRSEQPMALKQKERATAAAAPEPREVRLAPQQLPEIVSGLRIRQMTPFGNMHVKITVDPKTQRELEVFAQLGKGGDVATSDLEAICRMISLWLRSGGSLDHVIKQLENIGSSLQIPTRGGRIMSLGDGLAKALKKYLRAKEVVGLKALLLGEYDPSDLEERPDMPARPKGVSGNGKKAKGGNGHGRAGDGIWRGAARLAGGPVGESGGAARNAPVSPAHATAAGPGCISPLPSATSDDSRASAMAYKIQCPECRGVLSFSEGCVKCHSCGYAQC